MIKGRRLAAMATNAGLPVTPNLNTAGDLTGLTSPKKKKVTIPASAIRISARMVPQASWVKRAK